MKIGGCWGSEGDLSLFKVFEIFLRGQNGVPPKNSTFFASVFC